MGTQDGPENSRLIVEIQERLSRDQTEMLRLRKHLKWWGFHQICIPRNPPSTANQMGPKFLGRIP